MSQNQSAIIIGATSGIGAALALLLVNDGYKVGITGRRGALLAEIKNTNPEKFISKTFDVTDTDNAIKNLNELANELGTVDLIIISAGTGDINKELSLDIEQRTVNTNIVAFTAIANWATHLFKSQKQGHLVAISSIGGLRGSREAPAYNASKAFQINYLEGLRQKATKTKLPIYVTDIRPGLVDTAMAKGEGLFWVMPVEKATKQIYTAIQRKKKVAYVTKRWAFIASILKRLPKFIYDKM